MPNPLEAIRKYLIRFESSYIVRNHLGGKGVLSGRPGSFNTCDGGGKATRVGPAKTARLLKEGAIRRFPDLFDRGVKLASESEALSQAGRKAA